MFSPRIIIMIPAIKLIYINTPPIRRKVAETRIPMAINTMLKPKTKPAAVNKRFGLKTGEVCSDLSLALKPTPPKMLKYDGISGSTHGDRNESKPAAKTKNSGRSSTILLIIVLYYTHVNL